MSVPKTKSSIRTVRLPPSLLKILSEYRKRFTRNGFFNLCLTTAKQEGVTMINEHLYEGRYTPTNAYGKWEAYIIYAKTCEECEEKLAAMIAEVKTKIGAEKERLKLVKESFTPEIR